MIRDDQVYLEHVLESFSRILDYMDNVNFDAFLNDEEKQDAVIRKIEVAGEAVKRLSPAFKESNPDIPWRAIAGMRDKLIHDYFNVDLETVWETAMKDVPELLTKLSSLLP